MTLIPSPEVEAVAAKRRGPIPRDAFDAVIDIAQSSVEASPFYSRTERQATLNIIRTIEEGVLNIAGLRRRAHLKDHPNVG